MYARHRLDIDSRTLLSGLLGSLRPWDRSQLERSVKGAFPRSEEILISLSVRSGFELLLEALHLPEGSEAIVSAVTHPDMVSLLERHGLRVVPVDLDIETLEPRLELIEAAIGPKTRLVIIAHLFGTRIPLGELADLARASGLLLVEDCAQSFRGPAADADSPADVSMFSFGTIKTSTALGGAVLRVRPSPLRTRMERLQRGWPIQSRAEYVAKSLRYLVLDTASRPVIYGLVFRGSRLLGADLDGAIRWGVRGFGASADEAEYLQSLRRRPSNPLLAMLARRMSRFNIERFERRVLLGEQLQHSLPNGVAHPGARAETRTHWLFPLITSDPEAMRANLAAAGFDATPATSAIDVIHAPASRVELEPTEAAHMMERLLFVPLYPELAREGVDRLADVLAERDEPRVESVSVLADSTGGVAR